MYDLKLEDMKNPSLVDFQKPPDVLQSPSSVLTTKSFILCTSMCAALIFTDIWFHFLLLAIIWYLVTEHRYRYLYIAIKTFPRDISLSISFVRLMVRMKLWELKGWTTAQIFYNLVEKHPGKTAFIHEDKAWNFYEVEDYSNRVACYFKEKGIKRGDAVAVFMESCPQYVACWLGLTKIGAVGALINTNQRQQVLAHSVSIADCKAIICGIELCEALAEVIDKLPNVQVYIVRGMEQSDILPNSVNLDKALFRVDNHRVVEDIEQAKMTDKILYIYTSGTTGLPKAAVMTHARFIFMALGANKTLRVRENDIIYTSLPLYHTAGGLLGVGQALLHGNTVILRSKFSVSNFWTDCIKHKCTVAQYIGEMCRYLLAAPERPEERLHNVRLMVGNGLRPQIWKQFVKRFSVKEIGEFYGATEGNANLINADNTVGAVGYMPWFASPIYPVVLIHADPVTNEPVRGEDGFCIRCKPGEPGILIGRITQSRPSSHFNGYADKKASEKKVLRDVFKKGDMFFNSGDILVKDEYGYFYFKDRTGDTFRWRGENVATSEVEAVISNVVGLRDAVVYGVEIPNVEGRAGMAAVVDEEGVLDLNQLLDGMKQSLPAYARPVFLRVTRCPPLTGTYKLKKLDLQKEGYNPSTMKDPLYFLNPSTGTFVPLTSQLYDNIVSGKQRL